MSGRVLITGGFGYLGGRLARHLAADGTRSVRVTTRRPPSQWPDWAGEVEVATADLSAPDDLARACSGVDTVLHLAAANEIVCGRDPVLALEANAVGSLQLLRAAEQQGVRRFVYFSTAHVYGAPLAGRIDEGMAARPVHPYAISHRTAEDFVLAARSPTGLVLRLSNVIGAPADPLIDRWTLVGTDLCRQAVEKGHLRLQSSGLQRRDFVALSDVLRAVSLLLDLPSESRAEGLFNLGSGRAAPTVLAIAELVAGRAEAVLGFRPEILRASEGAGERHLDLDYRIDRLRSLGFEPTGDLATEIDDTLRLCRDAFKAVRT